MLVINIVFHSTGVDVSELPEFLLEMLAIKSARNIFDIEVGLLIDFFEVLLEADKDFSSQQIGVVAFFFGLLSGFGRFEV